MSRARRQKQFEAMVAKYGVDAIAAVVAGLRSGALKPSQFYRVPVCVYHDDGCDELAGKGPCNCNRAVGPPRRVPGPEEN
jgi:hypothetical protein